MTTARNESARLNYINSKPAISYQRAKLWTQSHKETEGQSISQRRAKAFKFTCENLDVKILIMSL